MRFDLNDLRLFVTAAEEGNLTRAAGRHNLSLAAVSARIKALEAVPEPARAPTRTRGQ